MPRPRKYATVEESRAADREKARIRMAERRAAGRAPSVAQPAADFTFIAYDPTPSDIPTITPLNLGLCSDVVGVPQPITPPQTQSQGVQRTTPRQPTPRKPSPRDPTPRQLTPQSSMLHEPAPRTPSPQKLRRPTPQGSTPRIPLHASRDLTISVSPLRVTPLALQPPAFFLCEVEEILADQEAIRYEDCEPILDVPNTPASEQPIPTVEEDVLDNDVLDPLETGLDDLDLDEAEDISDAEEATEDGEVTQDQRGAWIVHHLAKQLRWFKGCSRTAHASKRHRHRQHHSDVAQHPDCHSLEQITEMLKGTFQSTTPPLPDVLASPQIMPASRRHPGSNLRMIFEGRCSEGEVPRSFCLDTKHIDRAGGAPNVSYDIDSTVCFPSSLAVAKEGIFMYETFNETQSFKRSIHFATPALQLDGNNRRTTAPVPLHLVPHYCFGTVRGADDMVMHVFFPHLRASNYPVDNNRLSDQDLEIWFEQVLIPARDKAISDSNYLAHLTPSHQTAKLAASAMSKETMATKETAGKQRVGVHIQPRYLEAMWRYVLQTIRAGIEEHNECERFAKPLLLLSSKNTKLNHMETTDASVPSAYGAWFEKWQRTTDPRFYNAENVFVDIAKQITAPSSTGPYGEYDDPNPEVYMWRDCCMKTYLKARRRECHRHRKGEPSSSPAVARYPFASFDKSGSMTIASQYGTFAYKKGLIYTQFYSLVKTPFDASKTFPFQNEAMENLALDPGYVKTLKHVGGARTFSPAVCENSYLHSKARADAALNHYKRRSLGVREEHRVSLSLLQEVVVRWHQLDEEEALHAEADRESDEGYA